MRMLANGSLINALHGFNSLRPAPVRHPAVILGSDARHSYVVIAGPGLFRRVWCRVADTDLDISSILTEAI
jgi:hypothetical protein|eukprot:COSAG02_NODE_2203_length_9520_cov_14.356013_5_plen_71_part_00